MTDSELVNPRAPENERVEGSGIDWLRVWTAVVAGLVTGLLLASTIGLLPGQQTVGAADNGDGVRLYCGVGLDPVGTEASSWRGGVVIGFTRDVPCSDPQPSSALAVLQLAAIGQDSFSLRTLGWLYVGMFSTVTMLAVWASSARRLRRSWLLLPVLLPVFDADYSRFLISTYAEPAGLFGAFTMLCGVAVAAATDRTRRAERLVAIGLIGCGAFIAGSAKIGYVAVVVVGILLAVSVPVRVSPSSRPWSTWMTGVGVAVLVGLATVFTTTAGLAWHEERYPAVNAHNLIYTVALTEVEGAAARLGLPEAANDFAGEAYFPRGPADVAGAELVAAEPTRYRNMAWSLLARSPLSFLDVVGTGLQATQGRSLAYLPREPWTAESIPPTLGEPISGAQGTDSLTFRAWLDEISMPWMPSVLVLLGGLAGAASLKWRRHTAAGLARLAGGASLCALGVSVVAVLGDGYFELAKHVWLAAYFLDVTLLALAGAVLCVLAPVARAWYRDRFSRDLATGVPSLP